MKSSSSAYSSVSPSESRSVAESEPGSHGTLPGSPPKRNMDLSWSDSQEYEATDEPAPTAEGTPPANLHETGDLLRKERARFQSKVPVGLSSKLCSPQDRTAVVMVYDIALSRISANNYHDIYVEAKSKINILLGLRTADFTDPAFRQGLLPPLEPMYAHPRVNYSEDQYGRHAQWRLNAWRKDRWPLFLPETAVKRERARKSKKLAVGEERWELDEEDWDDPISAALREKDDGNVGRK